MNVLLSFYYSLSVKKKWLISYRLVWKFETTQVLSIVILIRLIQLNVHCSSTGKIELTSYKTLFKSLSPKY